jgi:transposase-like protein
MVAAVRKGQSLREVAHAFGVSPGTVLHWVRHANGQRLDRVDWSDGSHTPYKTQRTAEAVEDLVLQLRRELRQDSDLGYYGAEVIRETLAKRHVHPLPSVRTIGRILQRRGALDGRQRVRRTPPPLGWYLPEVAAGRQELDSVDAVEGLKIRDGPLVEVLNAVSLHGGLASSWPQEGCVTARAVTDALIKRWKAFGLPGYAQFDNGTIFQGSHAHPDVIGRVSRLCLSLGVTVVFAPPHETGFQASIESYNGSWQLRVWGRFQHGNLTELCDRSQRHVAALRRHRADRIAAAPPRRRFPKRWEFDPKPPFRGRLIYLRRTDPAGAAVVLGRHFDVDSNWPNRLVRAEVDLVAGSITFYRLRRRDPADQPVIKVVMHRVRGSACED